MDRIPYCEHLVDTRAALASLDEGERAEVLQWAAARLGIDPVWHSMGFETFSIACLLDPEPVGLVLGPVSDWYAEVTQEL